MYACMYVYTLFKSTHADKTLPVSVVHYHCQVAWPMHPSKNFQIFAKIFAPFATPKFGTDPGHISKTVSDVLWPRYFSESGGHSLCRGDT